MGKTYKLEEYQEQTRYYEIVTNKELPEEIIREVFYWGDGDDLAQGQETDMTSVHGLKSRKMKLLM